MSKELNNRGSDPSETENTNVSYLLMQSLLGPRSF